MRSPSWPDPLYGQCRCGATLTVDHLRNHCPLRPQQLILSDAQRAHLVQFIKQMFDARLDTTNVAELGYN